MYAENKDIFVSGLRSASDEYLSTRAVKNTANVTRRIAQPELILPNMKYQL